MLTKEQANTFAKIAQVAIDGGAKMVEVCTAGDTYVSWHLTSGHVYVEQEIGEGVTTFNSLEQFAQHDWPV